MREGRLVNGGLYLLGAVGIVATMLGTAAVISRYVVSLPLSFSDEVVTYLIVWAFLIGIGLGEAQKAHIRATILLDAMKPNWQRITNIFSLAVGIGFAIVIVWYGAMIVQQRFMLGEVSATVLRFPQWVARLCIPFGFGLVVLAAIFNLVALVRRRDSDHP